MVTNFCLTNVDHNEAINELHIRLNLINLHNIINTIFEIIILGYPFLVACDLFTQFMRTRADL